MKYLLRPYKYFGFVVTIAAAMTPAWIHAQMREVGQLLEQRNPLLLRASSQGYLGVDLADVDQERAQALKLKDVRGAIVTIVDHDAPAGQIGLKVNDVVLQLNGQPVEGAEQLRRMLREIPAGRKVSIEISRDGALQTLTVALADRRIMEQDVWNRIGSSGDVFSFSPGMGMLAASGGDAPPPGSFHMPFFGSSLKVGALVEPLTSQMAEYLGVENGLMVKQVASKSEAAAAGMKVFDVILKVGGDPISTLADWDRALRANEGKPVQVTLLRDRKQQTLTLQVDSKRHSELEMEDFFPAGDGMALAWTGPEFNQAFAFDPAQAQALRDQAEALRNQLKGLEQFKLSPEQAEQIRQKAEELSKSFKTEDFKLDPKQMGELKQQMEEFRKSFKPEEFEIDPKSMDQLKQQMEDLKRQMENWKAPAAGGRV